MWQVIYRNIACIGGTSCRRKMTEDGHNQIKSKGIIIRINLLWHSLHIILITFSRMRPVYPVWGAPSNHHPASIQMWGPPGYPPWQQADSWHWKPYPGMHADTWGCPVMPPPHGSYSSFPQNASGFHNSSAVDNSYPIPQNSFDVHPAEEILDKVVKEAISKPWLPLPLGLKPPSAESVLAELSRQGISTIPPDHINGSYPC
ncbi:two-component response regulator-like APRR2 [Melia azedarach]|uniref:Two-component response regulator-like APRR2 n=1 Tax=Melia azedarach TaxID=155640 RepID=A0ACC1YZF8_MELAZ|nr:two-component response regulator-like APRR2 [Melia azedarach]